LKNFTQAALISAVAWAEPAAAPAGAVADGDAAGDDVAGVADTVAEADVLAGAGADEDEDEPLEQADIAVTSTRPSAGARQIRRAVGVNRIVTLLGLPQSSGVTGGSDYSIARKNPRLDFVYFVLC
jgi:hypothetical protein